MLSEPLPYRQNNIPGKEMVCLGATGTLPQSQDWTADPKLLLACHLFHQQVSFRRLVCDLQAGH